MPTSEWAGRHSILHPTHLALGGDHSNLVLVLGVVKLGLSQEFVDLERNQLLLVVVVAALLNVGGCQ